jgi:hypothetical protein
MSASGDNVDITQEAGLRKPIGVNGGGPVRLGHHSPMVDVQPPRREDLQPSYAQTLVGESEQGNEGWYGGMSKSSIRCAILNNARQHAQSTNANNA